MEKLFLRVENGSTPRLRIMFDLLCQRELTATYLLNECKKSLRPPYFGPWQVQRCSVLPMFEIISRIDTSFHDLNLFSAASVLSSAGFLNSAQRPHGGHREMWNSE